MEWKQKEIEQKQEIHLVIKDVAFIRGKNKMNNEIFTIQY